MRESQRHEGSDFEPSLPLSSALVPNISDGGPNASTPTHDNRPSSRGTGLRQVSKVPIHSNSGGENRQLPYDPHRVIDFTKTPRSLEILRNDNKILR